LIHLGRLDSFKCPPQALVRDTAIIDGPSFGI
jgi:hypothetical protein